MRVMQSHCSSAGVTFRLYLKTPDAFIPFSLALSRSLYPSLSLSLSVFLHLLLDAGAALIKYASIKGRRLPPPITASHLSEAGNTNADSVAYMSGILLRCHANESLGAKGSFSGTYAARLKKQIRHAEDLSCEHCKWRQRSRRQNRAATLWRSRGETADSGRTKRG